MTGLRIVEPRVIIYIALNDLIRTMMVRVEPEMWACSSCSYSTRFYSTMQSHIESKHIISPGVQCEICHVFSPTRQALKMHMSRKHKNPMLS